MGRLSEAQLPDVVSRVVMGTYAKAYRVDLDEALPTESAYPSFDAFFTRPLREGARRVADARVVSPADGQLSSLGRVDRGGRIYAKGQGYALGDLVGAPSDAERYHDGSFFVVYLSPRDYHRVHSPVAGHVSLIRGIPGDLFPVNSIGERYVPGLFVRNNRVAICIDTEQLGRVTVVMVGAMIVGRISVSVLPDPAVPPGVHTIEPKVEVSRGDEIGIFHLGSTAVVLLEPGVTISRPVGPVRYGEALTGAT
ncbi:MAG: phosphatidylserine decarboxylase [Polyangiaceae bacterium]|nr:phosphatidylserine decarboxylase [Polyangiaceae bacterium]MCB9608027.1 phosphatidylserine decarboxylase [Polyangiaceae bacterium]